jgi:uncharacterized UBP type Zn finger protein
MCLNLFSNTYICHVVLACKGGNIENEHHNVGKMDASPSMSKVLQDLTNSCLLSSKEIQSLVGGKENNLVW